MSAAPLNGMMQLAAKHIITAPVMINAIKESFILYPHCSAALIAKDQIINTKAIPAPNTVPITIVKNKVTINNQGFLRQFHAARCRG